MDTIVILGDGPLGRSVEIAARDAGHSARVLGRPADGRHSPDDLADAAIVRNSDEAKALLAEAVADDVGAIGPYIAPVQVDEAGKILPGNLREQIRRDGVTIGLPV